MKETPERLLSYRANAPSGSGAINGPQWQTVRPPPVPVQQTTKRGGFPWRLFLFMVGLIWVGSVVMGNRSRTPQERSAQQWVESTRAVPQSTPAVRVERAEPVVKRALPVGAVPRAEAVGSGLTITDSWLDDPANVDKWIAMMIPGEGSVWVRYKGRIPGVDSLPANPQRWDWYYAVNGTSWIWMAPASTGRLGWMDP